MKIIQKITISSPAADVWAVLGDQFVSVDEWMAGIGKSVEITEGQQAQNAPTIGRRGEVAINPGTFLDETIEVYNPENMSLIVQTDFVNIPGPVQGYKTEIQVQSLGNDASEVSWSTQVPVGELEPPIYSAVEKNLSDGFFRGLEELKHFVEMKAPHERKLAAPHCG
ncbi:hypothetical protein BKI52_04615 [marine bacterium AO1-C]|nr:hypothetical protein BKI52_04615 [marine bacterium AO1-C]